MGGLGGDGVRGSLSRWTYRHEEALIRLTGVLWLAAALGYSVLRSVNG